MARPRADTLPKEPHSVSLKVLRLSRPSFALQHPLPRESDIGISPLATLAYPSKSSDQDFILSSNLSLPPAFGSAYVGETFSCSLCANNELPAGSSKAISGIRIVAEMQTPSQSIPLQLHSSSDDEANQTSEPGVPLQRIIRFDLKEEGNHVLAVNLSYTESGGSPATSGKVRSFRKLYQFQAQPCLSVRTKATELPSVEVADKTLGPYGRSSLSRYALEAQLENVSDGMIVLEAATLKPRAPFRSTSLNWDAESNGARDEAVHIGNPILNPRDVLQVAYLIEQQRGASENLEELKAGLKRDGRVILGQLSISWHGNMGETGSLSTGNLLSRRKL